MKQCRQQSLLSRKFRDSRRIVKARTCYSRNAERKREEENERGKERERNTHVNALTDKTTVDANSERGSLVFSSQQPRGIRERRTAGSGARGKRGTRRIKGGRNADEKRGRVEEGRGSPLMNSNI